MRRACVVLFLVAIAISQAVEASDSVNAALEQCVRDDGRENCPAGEKITDDSPNPWCKQLEPVKTCEDLKNGVANFKGEWSPKSTFRTDYLACMCAACGGTVKDIMVEEYKSPERKTCSFDSNAGGNEGSANWAALDTFVSHVKEHGKADFCTALREVIDEFLEPAKELTGEFVMAWMSARDECDKTQDADKNDQAGAAKLVELLKVQKNEGYCV